MSSNFNFYVNRQGIQGIRGAKGEPGFSPVITVNTETANEYILQVENETGSFLTPNLRGNAIENTGGTYVRFNPETENMYTGYADSATTENSGVVRFSTYAELVAGDVEDAVPSAMDVNEFVQNSIDAITGFVTTSEFSTYVDNTAITLNSLSTNKLDASTFNSYTATTDAAIGALDTNKLDFSDLASSLVAGNNVTLTVDSVNNTITIDSSGGTFTQVQANWAETDTDDPSFIQNKPALFSGDYDDLTNKPTLGTMAAEDASDYTPTASLADVATTGDYDDLLNKPTIPAAQVQSDWNQSDSNEVDFIKNKPSIPSVGDGTITLTQGGVTKGTFTTNQSGNTTIDLDAGGGSSLTAGNGIDINSNDEIDIAQSDPVDTYSWNVTTVGNPTVNDGVYSGFSSSNYLTFANPTETVTSFELDLIFTTGANVNVGIFGGSTNLSPTFNNAPKVYIDSQGILRFEASSSSSSLDIALYSSSPVSSNTKYREHIIWDGTTFSGTFYDLTNETSEILTPVAKTAMKYTDTTTIGKVWATATSYIFDGSVDLKNSFMKVNGSLHNITYTGGGAEVAKATSSLYGLVKPDNSTITVSNGVISISQSILDQISGIETILNDINSGNGGQS